LAKIAIFISALRRASAKRVGFIEPHHECRAKSYFYLIVVIQKSVADFGVRAAFLCFIVPQSETVWCARNDVFGALEHAMACGEARERAQQRCGNARF